MPAIGGKSAKSSNDRTGVRSGGAGQGKVGGSGSGMTGAKASVALKAKDPNSHIGSQNAAIGTFAQDRTALNNAYGGPVDNTGLLGRMFGIRTYKNPISGGYAGTTVDLGSILGGLASLGTGVPGLSALGGLLSPDAMNVGFGPEFGSWRNGGQGTASPGLNGGRGSPFGGMPGGAPGAVASSPTSAAPAQPISFGGIGNAPNANYGLLSGYTAPTRFGTGTLAPVQWGR